VLNFYCAYKNKYNSKFNLINMEEYSRKRKRDNYNVIIKTIETIERKRKIDEINNIDIIDNNNKYQRIDYINVNINNKKNKTYNCFIHDNLKEVCNIYQCSGTIFINTNENIMYQYIK
jgi:hypothetical protein